VRDYLRWMKAGLVAAAAAMAGVVAYGQAPAVPEEEAVFLEMEHAETQPGEHAATMPSGSAVTQPITQPVSKPATQPGGQGAVQAGGDEELEKRRRARIEELKARAAAAAATQPTTQAEASASTQPTTQASTQPATQPTTRPSTQASTQPTTKPATTQPKALLQMAPVRPNWDHYRVIYQRNMFMAQRSGGSIFGTEGQIPKTQETPRVPTVTAAPRALWVLTGVAVLDDDKMAFAENMSTGVTVRARPGDKLGDWKVVSISAEGVEVESEGKAMKVVVGASLDGRSVEGVLSSGAVNVVQPDAPAASSSGGGSGSGVGAVSTPGTSDEAAIRERLKRRRQEQGGN
jgi:hypothetical protein